jgi:hypothetical protein
MPWGEFQDSRWRNQFAIKSPAGHRTSGSEGQAARLTEIVKKGSRSPLAWTAWRGA